MLQTQQEQFQEPDYPSFPVVFQRDLQAEFEVTEQKSRSRHVHKTISVPQHDAHAILKLSETFYETKYPHLFSQYFEPEKMGLDNFFKQYLPINELFVQEMKKNMDSLKIIRLSTNKIFVGSIVDGKCSGKSIIIFKNGNLYEGQMLDNKRNGSGIYVHVNIGWYKGQFRDDVKHGHGIEIFYHKSAYKGDFFNGLRHDSGLYMDNDGNIYDGFWKMGIMHGKGILKTHKSIYKGNFVNFLKHGDGQQNFTNGDNYRGEYHNGRFDGIGVYEWKSESAIYEGNFKNGLRHGKGKWQRGDAKYIGGYIEGLKQGYGQLYYQTGNFYKGNFVEDKKDGYGEMFWKDSSFYKGQWRNGVQNGKGQMYLLGGDIINGIFQGGMMVQMMPTTEQQMEISNLKMMGFYPAEIQKVEKPDFRNRAFSQAKSIPRHRKLARIDEATTSTKKKTGNSSIHANMYFRSPAKNMSHTHADGHECKTCSRRLQNFRLKQQRGLKRTLNMNENSASKDKIHL